MSNSVLTKETATEDAKRVLEKAESKYGFVPNLIGMMSNAPALAEAYLALNDYFSQTSLSKVEQQVVLLSASFENNCTYCMAAHSTIAKQAGMPDDTLKALRDGTEIPDSKLNALSIFTRAIVISRGLPTDEQIGLLKQAGFTDQQALEVVLGVGLKTLSNYTNHLADTPLDDKFSQARWEKP